MKFGPEHQLERVNWMGQGNYLLPEDDEALALALDDPALAEA